jgi:hypothetical protein
LRTGGSPMRTRDECSYKSANCGASRLHTGSYFTLTAVLLASTVTFASNRYHDSDYRHWTQPGTDIPVPDEKIIRERNPSGEDGHLCNSSGKVIYFVPPSGK